MDVPPVEPAPNVEPALSRPMRWFLLAVAAISLLLALIGAVLPVMPTVPFVLVAAWAAAKSSPRLARWLETHPHMGPHIRAWRAGGVVPRRVKWISTATMSGGGAFAVAFVDPWWAAAGVVGTMVVVGTWIWLRPEVLASAGE